MCPCPSWAARRPSAWSRPPQRSTSTSTRATSTTSKSRITRTEEALQAGLNHLLTGRTSFIIAHRLSTIENADEIYYIDHGQIVEHGSHAELLEKKGAYYRLYESQYAMIRVGMGEHE